MTRNGKSRVSIARDCTGEVWVRSTRGGRVADRRQIERVLVGARRMVRRDVERAEIVPVALDVRPFGDGKPIAPKIAAISSIVRLIGWISPRDRGRGGSVGSSRSAASRPPAPPPPAPCAVPRSPPSARPSARSAPHRARAAARAPSCPRSFSRPVTVPFLPKHRDAHRIPGAQIGGLCQGRVGLGLQGLKIV